MATNTSSLAEVNGIELAYQVFGKGEPLILLHGGFGSAEMFGPNVELLWMTAGMDVMGPETVQFLMQSPMYEAYQRNTPRVEDWPVLVRQVAELLKVDYDWSSEITTPRRLRVILVRQPIGC